MPNKISVPINPALKALIPDFLESCKTDLSKISIALDNADYESIRIIGHNFRGCGSGYGFTPITNLGTNIESAAEQQQIEVIIHASRELTEYLDNVIPVYE